MIPRRLIPILVVACATLALLPGVTAASRGGQASSPAGVLPPAWLAEPAADDGAADTDDVPEPGYVENQLVVRFKPGVSPEIKRQLHLRYGAQVIAEQPSQDVQLLQLYDDAMVFAAAYQDRNEVLYAEPNYIYEIMGAPAPGAPIVPGRVQGGVPDMVPNDPQYPQQWHLAKINAATAWDYDRGTNVIVAVIDTGVTCNHPDLSGKCVPGYDFVNQDSNPADDHGHGTHVSGIAAATTNNAVGVAGSGWGAKVMPLKALNGAGQGGQYEIGAAIDWAVAHGADVINMSLGGPYSSSTVSSAVARAVNAGVTVVAAAGNDGWSNPSYPAAYQGVIGVGATTQSDARASFSNYGTYVDVVAPGVGILSTVMTGGYQAWNGTSMASPVVAGVAALLIDQDPSRSPAQVQSLLETTAVDLGTPGRDSQFGAGRIDAGAALAYGAGGAPTPGGPATATPTYPPPTATPSAADGWVQQVEDLINAERVRVALPPLRSNPQLRSASARHANDMARGSFCSHNGSDGSSAYSRMREAGYPSPYGEIVACGQTSPAAVVAAWMDSAGHRAIILCTTCTELGAGHAVSTAGYWNYWTVTFGSAPVSGPTPTPAQPPTAVPTSTTGPPTSVPSATPTPPGVPPGGEEVVLSPANNRIGWVVSTRPNDNFFDDDDTFTGVYLDNRIYHGAMQFDLDRIPANAYVNYARLEMTGRSNQFLGTSGTWAVRILDTAIDAGFAGHGYAAIHNASPEATLLPLLGIVELGEDRQNVFTFSPSQVAVLATRVAGSRRLSFRIDGPTGGSSMNLFTWDTGYGPETRYPGPKLVVHTSSAPPTVAPSPTATDLPGPTDIPPTPTDGPPPTFTPVLPTATATATAPPPPEFTPTPTGVPTIRPEPGLLEIAPAVGDAGWVKEGENGNHFGDSDMFTGYYQGSIYHGAFQFDLSAIPTDRSIVEARITVTGRDGRYLSRFGNGRWRLAVLESDADVGWRSHSYRSIHGAGTLGLLSPDMIQGDLDVGRANVFLVNDDLVWFLQERVRTTKKLSLRLDGPRAGVSNVFSWATGATGEEPPRLSIVLGPPGGDQPVPTQDPLDAERVRDLIRRINAEREKAGVPPLAVSEEITVAAKRHTIDMAMHDFFSHDGSDGSTPTQRVASTGFNAAAVGEVLAAANADPYIVVDAWMARDQKAVILDPRFTHIGAHYLLRDRTAYRHYWTADLAQAVP